jgi:hypothetical protein
VRPVADQLRSLARQGNVVLGGAAATSEALGDDGVRLLAGDVISEAARLTP